jgi:thiamine biosynthesis protein ThiS
MNAPAGDPATVWLNGERREIGKASTIAGLLEELRIPVHALLIEHNGSALHHNEWEACKIHPDDRIEIIRIVAGG